MLSEIFLNEDKINKLKGKKQIPQLIRLLKTKNPQLKQKIIDALISFNVLVIDPLIAMNRKKGHLYFESSIEIFTGIGEPCITPLIDVLKKERENWAGHSYFVIHIIALVFCKLKPTSSVPVLCSIFRNPNGFSDTPRSVIEALGKIGDYRAIEDLVPALIDPYVRDDVRNALRVLKGKIKLNNQIKEKKIKDSIDAVLKGTGKGSQFFGWNIDSMVKEIQTIIKE